MIEPARYNKIKDTVFDDFQKLSIEIKKTIDLLKNENIAFGNDIQQYLCGNSKQIRACLLFLFANAILGKTNENIIKLASAVEIIHNATLIHDDIIDNALIRRGHTTINKKYDSKLSIIAGDFLLSIAINILNSIKNPSIIKNFSNCLISLCKGEINQYFSKQETPTIKEYIEKSKNKTASLFIATLKSLSNLNNNIYEKELINFALNFGIAFQINDYLNNILNEKKQKPLFNDISSGIYTAPIIFGYGENKNLANIKTNDILKTAKEEKNINLTKKLINHYISLAKAEIRNLPESIYTQALNNLCNIFS